jgi:hypothetical protein
MQFFPKYAAFNIGWREVSKRRITSYIPPRRGILTKPGTGNHAGTHVATYARFLKGVEPG